MFKKSRKRIVASIMGILIVLWIGTLAIIYTSSYIEMTNRNERMLKMHSEMYTPAPELENEPPQKPGHTNKDRLEKDMPGFKLSTFYTVVISSDGEITEINNEQPDLHSDDDLKNLALKIYNSKKTSGSLNNLAYYVTNRNTYTLVAFMDNTVLNESAETLLRYTAIFGGVALVLFFFIAKYLAKRIVAPLEESYSKQKQFISDAGHELKTPLSVMSVNSELLLKEIGENEWLSNIRYENERMKSLVTRLLELARTESVSRVTEVIDFGHLVFGEVLPFESVIYENGLRLVTNIDEKLEIHGDRLQLKQLVSVLLDNAVSHSESGGTVTVELTRESGGNVRLSVFNTGEEIPKEKRELIFERFYRMDESRTSGDEHYGLGLAIAKAIVTSHKGKIAVFCKDGIVEFRVILPN